MLVWCIDYTFDHTDVYFVILIDVSKQHWSVESFSFWSTHLMLNVRWKVFIALDKIIYFEKCQKSHFWWKPIRVKNTYHHEFFFYVKGISVSISGRWLNWARCVPIAGICIHAVEFLIPIKERVCYADWTLRTPFYSIVPIHFINPSVHPIEMQAKKMQFNLKTVETIGCEFDIQQRNG